MPTEIWEVTEKIRKIKAKLYVECDPWHSLRQKEVKHEKFEICM